MAIIGCPPNRQNIMYEVQPLVDMDTFSSTVARDIKTHGLEYPKTIVFLRRYTDCAALYQSLKRKLNGHITFPPNYPVLQQFAVLSMYTRASKVGMKEKVLTSFCDPKGRLRIVPLVWEWAAQTLESFIIGVHQQVLKCTCKNQGELVEMVCHQKPYCYMANQANTSKKMLRNMCKILQNAVEICC